MEMRRGNQSVAYTALGEILDPNGHPGGSLPTGFPRYAYAGGWGYETGGFGDASPGPGDTGYLLSLSGANPNLPPITLQHVGWRWYQPDTGRFVQRDPIGIRAGINVYVYVFNMPVALLDPWGLRIDHDIVIIDGHVLIHFYDYPSRWKFWKDPAHIGTKRIPVNGVTPGHQSDQSGFEDDVNAFITQHTKALADLVGQGLAELDDEIRKAIEHWLGHVCGGTGEGLARWYALE